MASITAMRAPAASSAAFASPSSPSSPPSVSCVSERWFAIDTLANGAITPSTCSSVSPTTESMPPVPGGTAPSITAPRLRTRDAPAPSSSTPDAASAVYSPSESPA